ncbi:MAG TPA: cupredoxin domain-containing protein [Nitrososphaeraceae archaeon]|nr:cupredoxin domain-containing protein [Nitrososphaeraceae archaeon]
MLKQYILNSGFLHIAVVTSMAVLVIGVLSFAGFITVNPQPGHDHIHQALAQPVGDFPIPDAKRMFTNDTALIKRFTVDPYILDMALMPKSVVTGQPALFVLNAFHKPTMTWLWHTDYDVSITDLRTGQKELVFPNLHGHGSVVQFEYTFPRSGLYKVDIIFGQQTGSPNFIVEPKVIKEVSFPLTVTSVGAQSPSLASKGQHVDVIPVKVQSWKFTPNQIDVKKGDLVRMIFTTAQDEVELYNGHGFGIEGYNVNVFLLKGTQQVVEFVADKPGTFTFRCTSFCSSPEAALENHFNMMGKFVVHT